MKKLENFSDLLFLETVSRDSILVRRLYVDLAGDLAAGIMLSQIIYWHLPLENGNPKLQIKKENKLWLAKRREDWWEECRLTTKQADRALKILISKDLIESKLFKFNGSPVKHIRLKVSVITERVNSILTKGGKRYLPKGENDIYQRGKSLTKTTTETTTETTRENTPRADFSNRKNQKEEKKEKSIPPQKEKKETMVAEPLAEYKSTKARISDITSYLNPDDFTDEEKTERANYLFRQLDNSETWLHDAMRASGGLTIGETKMALREFFRVIKAKDDYFKPLREIKAHFINWMNKNKKPQIR